MRAHQGAVCARPCALARYSRNGDLRVAYRGREGARDIVVVPNWFNCCEILPELPAIQGWFEVMTSLDWLIFFDQPSTGASDPVSTGALPTFEQWADSITAVLDDLGSREAVLVASNAAFAQPAVLFAASYPSRTTALVGLEVYADPMAERMVGVSGTGEFEHALNPDMPWNEEDRATWARHERLTRPTRFMASTSPITSPARSTLSCQGATCFTCSMHMTPSYGRSSRAFEVAR
jgi:pimeloyl-ACP methyl ester carboxylesterase